MYESMYEILLLDQHLPGPLKLVLLVIGWLVGNAVSSETFLRIFLIFLHQVRGLCRWKSHRAGYLKKILIWRYLQKGLQISPKSVIIGWLAA